MFQTDVCDDGGFGAVDDVGGVQFASHADFQYHKVAALFQKVLHGDGRHQLELAGVVFHCVGRHTDLFRDAGKVFSGNVLPVYLHALTEVLDVRGSVKACPVSGGAQDTVQHGTGGTFAVAARDVDKLQLLLRITYGMQQFSGARQAQPSPAPGIVFYVLNCFSAGHGSANAPLLSSAQAENAW